MRNPHETIKIDTPAVRDLRRRINLANRPRLPVGTERLDEISSTLARSGADRVRFIQDPANYLQAQELPISSCNLVKGSSAQTSEVCSAAVACNVNAAVNVNVGVNINFGVNINIYNTAYIYTNVRFFGYQEMERFDGSYASTYSPNSNVL